MTNKKRERELRVRNTFSKSSPHRTELLDDTLQRTLGVRVRKVLIRDWQLYLLCIPALLFVFVFNYGPMYGVQIAFKKFSGLKGIWGSPWVGLEHFRKFFRSPMFWKLLRNTLAISVYSLIASFPFPVLLALVMNQTRNIKFRKVVQMVIYAPHFISVVVLCGMISVFLSPSVGIVNNLMSSMGMERINFLGESSYFRHIYVWSDIWQNTGWGMIIYLASLAAISPELYEAAKIDGASKWQTIRYIDIPGILPQIVILFILRTGSFMSVGFQKAYLLQTPLNLETSEMISTYVYKIGLLNSQFAYSSAIGLFNTVVNLVLLCTVNTISRKLNETSLW